MAVVVGKNIPALRAMRSLAESTDAVNRASERLSSGLRINHASDDASGLAVSASLEANARVYSQGIRNLNDGLSATNVAQGALEQLTTITVRQMELAEQAANGSYSSQQRRALDAEASALTLEFNRIANITAFNGIHLLSGGTSIRLQAGAGIENSISIDFSALAAQLSTSVGTGTFTTAATLVLDGQSGVEHIALGDVNNDGYDDVLVTSRNGGADVYSELHLGNGDGTFKAASAAFGYPSYNPQFSNFADFNSDGNLDLQFLYATFLGHGDGTFTLSDTIGTGFTAKPVDLNGDGKLDLIGTSGTSFIVKYGAGDGTFGATVSYPTLRASYTGIVQTGDINGDGKIDLFTSNRDSPEQFIISLGNGDGSFKANFVIEGAGNYGIPALGDLNGDGFADIIHPGRGIFFGNGDGSFAQPNALLNVPTSEGAEVQILDVNGDGITDVATIYGGLQVWLGNGNGSFRYSTGNGSSMSRMASGDINGDGVIDFVGTTNGSGTGPSLQAFIADTVTSSNVESISLVSASAARDALTSLQTRLETISRQSGMVGAFQSRVAAALSNLESLRENYRAAASRITDADMAFEVTKLVSARIRQQAAAAVLTQARQSPALALILLGENGTRS